MRQEASPRQDAADATKEMTVMARVEHASRGFEREREDEKEGSRHEHSKKDRREDRTEDSRDE
jgi:hypothetical protein